MRRYTYKDGAPATLEAGTRVFVLNPGILLQAPDNRSIRTNGSLPIPCCPTTRQERLDEICADAGMKLVPEKSGAEGLTRYTLQPHDD